MSVASHCTFHASDSSLLAASRVVPAIRTGSGAIGRSSSNTRSTSASGWYVDWNPS
ncbi:hypothetical protein [Lentzea jiangxiensis]|uniref:hypothetical protein n=1 Tax=Lentzea jiangxiensis TaxID=641025 RepID=UPI0015A4DF3B|nr:hypothetical protein [Lentzea jiangxiensis]